MVISREGFFNPTLTRIMDSFLKSYFSDCCLMTEVSFLPCILLYQNKGQIVGSFSIVAFYAKIGKNISQ